MDKKILLILLAVLFFCNIYAIEPSTTDASLNISQIEQLTGAKGILDAKEQVFKVTVPRNDISVSAQGVKITPSMGLTSWAAFQKVNGKTMVMGDVVLLQDQVNPVMGIALANGLSITALHNHFFWESPRIMFMHIEAMGEVMTLAQAVGKVFAQLKIVNNRNDDSIHFSIDPANTTLDPNKIDIILGKKGTLKDGVYKVVIGRNTSMHGYSIGNTMGVNTWVAFAGSDDKAVVDGDFAMQESELQNVLKALQSAHIDIVAIHQHMIQEQPRIIFLHYWGIGKTVELARGLKMALDHISNNNSQ